MQILMIQINGKKKYYTEFCNLPMLIEFAKTFHAELFLVESPNIQPLDLEQLAPALCDDSYRSPRVGRGLRIVRKLWPEEAKESHCRQELLHNAKMIRQHIQTLLESGSVVRIAEVKHKFRGLDLTDSCLSNHMTVVRKEMARQGKNVVRTKIGVYTLTKQAS